ncbi:MAG: AmmeMemoRadiSam system radical SAM enzyme [Eubacteriaceae bacterium]|nr:AmmeMemoRadiSam system radical SAM enzyme [Eubacteriaceae bacterium]
MFWERGEGGSANCLLCPHACKIAQGNFGICRARKNVNGELVPLSYGKLSSIALDPIEKKPLGMFYPGKLILSLGSFGCNLRCPFCQNSSISMEFEEASFNRKPTSAGEVLDLAASCVPEGNIGIAYTYNEPFVAYEYMLDCAVLAHGNGLKNVVVTNGYVSEEPFEQILPYIDAMNIDLKGFSEGYYKQLGGSLDPVLRSIELAHKQAHVELTCLIVPDENSSEEHMGELASWVSSISPDIPLHISRFFGMFKYSGRQATHPDLIYRLQDVAAKSLNNIYLGNMG